MKREFSESYRKRLVAVRERLDLSRSEMAERMLTPLNTYKQWEAGLRSVPGVAVVAAESLRPEKARSRREPASPRRTAAASPRRAGKTPGRRAAARPRSKPRHATGK